MREAQGSRNAPVKTIRTPMARVGPTGCPRGRVGVLRIEEEGAPPTVLLPSKPQVYIQPIDEAGVARSCQRPFRAPSGKIHAGANHRSSGEPIAVAAPLFRMG